MQQFVIRLLANKTMTKSEYYQNSIFKMILLNILRKLNSDNNIRNNLGYFIVFTRIKLMYVCLTSCKISVNIPEKDAHCKLYLASCHKFVENVYPCVTMFILLKLNLLARVFSITTY